MALNAQIVSYLAKGEPVQKLTSRAVILAGETVLASFESVVPPGFISQQPRDATAGILAQFRRGAPSIQVSVDERLLQLPKVRFAFAFDGYLAWGLRRHHGTPMILFGGGQSESAQNIQILIFADGRLLELREKSMPAVDSSSFPDALSTMIDELRTAFPTARFVQAAPLADWNIDGIEYVGDRPLKRLSFRPIAALKTTRSVYLWPGLLGIVALLIYPAAVAVGWRNYTSATLDYEQAIADPAIKSKGGIDTDYLATLNARRMFMEQPLRQIELAEKAANIVNGIAGIQNVNIIELRLSGLNALSTGNAPAAAPVSGVDKPKVVIASERAPDVLISVATPISTAPAMEQAKSLMTEMSIKTGMSLRLAHQGWRDDQTRRVFHIEGFVHD